MTEITVTAHESSILEELVKKALASLGDEEVVPKHTKRVSEEETTFVRLERKEEGGRPTTKAEVEEEEEEGGRPTTKAGPTPGPEEEEKEEAWRPAKRARPGTPEVTTERQASYPSRYGYGYRPNSYGYGPNRYGRGGYDYNKRGWY